MTIVAFLLAPVSPAFAEDQKVRSTITLDRAVQFMAPDGNDVHLSPGTYHIEQLGETQLRLLTPDGQRIQIAATKTSHEETIFAPTAIGVIEEGPDDYIHVVLLLPGGQALDGAGLMTQVQSRGGALGSSPFFSSRQRYTGVVMQQGRMQTDADLNEGQALSSRANQGTQPPAQHYGRVTLEQGRVQLDADARRTLFQGCKVCIEAP
jgi:hypothetical protein